MEEFRQNHSVAVDQPLAHEAGVNHIINSSYSELKARNLRTFNYLEHRTIWEQENVEQDALSSSEQGSLEVRDKTDLT